MWKGVAALAGFVCIGAAPALAQVNVNHPPPPPTPGAQAESQPAPSKVINVDEPPPPPSEAGGDAPVSAKPKQTFDPLGAEKDIEVGNFYFKRGNYDAAIERFQDATQKHVGFAKPFMLLGEAYEKKNDPVNALKSYRQFLRLYPESPDRKKVEGRISDLEKRQPQEEQKNSSQ